MSEALITPEILQWARDRSHFSIQELAGKLSLKEEKVRSWEEGKEKPTFLQAQKLAHILHIPFGYLFLKHPPVEEDEIPDLRTLRDQGVNTLSIDLKEVIKDAQRKQDWYSDMIKESGSEPLSFIGRFGLGTPVNEIVEDINKTLSLTNQLKREERNWEAYLRLLIDKAEEAGIWVMRNSKVGNNTRRPLHIEEFRGFALCDDYAPLVFINSIDAKAAQIFTLIHEMAHLWLGKSGISDAGVDTIEQSLSNEIEKKCNAVAAELLVPALELKELWKEVPFLENVSHNASHFKVSKVVIARRAMDLRIIEPDEFFRFYAMQSEKWGRQKRKLKETDGGPSFYTLLPIYNGRKFTEAVLVSIYAQKTLLRNGARLLGVKPDKIDRIASEVGII